MNDCARQGAVRAEGRQARTWLLWGAWIACALLLAGCAHEQPAPKQTEIDYKSLVHKEISDPVRADKILALMEQLNAEIRAQMQTNQEFQKEFARLTTDYNTTPAQFQQAMDSARERRDKGRAKIMDTYFQIKALTTPNEWDALSRPEVQTMMDLLNTMEAAPKK